MHDVVIQDSGKHPENLLALLSKLPHARVTKDSIWQAMVSQTKLGTTEWSWILSDSCDYSDFDFDWQPDWHQSTHLHAWPTAPCRRTADTFLINRNCLQQEIDCNDSPYGCKNFNSDHAAVPSLKTVEIFIVDHGPGVDELKSLFPQAQIFRRLGTWKQMLRRIARHAHGNFWVISSFCNYENFDFSWQPEWDQQQQLHVWPTHNQKHSGDTFFVAENLDFDVALINCDHAAVPLQHSLEVFVLDMGSHDENVQTIKQRWPMARVLRYHGSHLSMLRKIATHATGTHAWVVSSCCDYSDWDWDWRPEWHNENYLHCWASGDQKFGDTFLLPVGAFRQNSTDLEKLEYFDSVEWHSTGVPRLPWPENYPDLDLFDAVKKHNFKCLYEWFIMPGSSRGSDSDPCLWEKRDLIAYNKNGHVSLVPRDIKTAISTEILDYHYIQYQNCEKSTQKPQDIVFISYDEINAEKNWKTLKDAWPEAKRIHAVKGNVQAYKAAAAISNTPWFYAVFPKTEIDPTFNFEYHPNYLIEPGHYIFNAQNTITGLCYGHGGVKMYHRRITVEIEHWGYDFTMSSPVTTIPVNSCFIKAATPYEAWRTSFREVLKLKNDSTVEGKYRLHCWLTIGKGEFGKYSIDGAKAALLYNGDPMLANSWEWLREQFNSQLG